jgi:flagellar L-ring protein FlgH
MSRRLAFVLPAAALLGACATARPPQVEMLDAVPAHMQAAAMQPVAAAGTPGAIFQSASHRPLFEDRRARLAGDTLTVVIEELVSASQQSTSKVDRTGSISAGVSALPLAPARLLGRMSVDANSGIGTNADGKTGSTNSFTGTITVLVREVLPNGNLLVTGEKQIGVNQNVDVLRFSGIVNPAHIRGGNVISSTQVAQARLEQRGRGDIGNIQGLGWLSRFFLSVAPV